MQFSEGTEELHCPTHRPRPTSKPSLKKGSRWTWTFAGQARQGKTVEGRFRVRNLTRFPAPDTRFRPPRLTSSLSRASRRELTLSSSIEWCCSSPFHPRRSAARRLRHTDRCLLSLLLRIRNFDPSSESALAFLEQRFRATRNFTLIIRRSFSLKALRIIHNVEQEERGYRDARRGGRRRLRG
jgi:hypothetical protein